MGSSPKNEKIAGTKDVDQIFEPVFAVFGFESVREKGFPVIDVYENSAHVLIEAELPGVNKANVNISLAEGEVVIEGDKQRDQDENENVKYICIERSFGKFRRSVEIPAAADTGKVRALFKDGVLLITIPKIKDQRRNKKKVEIE